MAAGDPSPVITWDMSGSPIAVTAPSFSLNTVLTTANTAGTGWVHLEPTGFSSPEFDEMTERIGKIEERLAILQPNIELHDKFPALRRAYEEYLMLEKLINGSRDNKKGT